MTATETPLARLRRRWPGFFSTLPAWRQPALFFLVGGYNTVFGLATFAVVHLLFRDLHYLAVLVISAVLSTINAFVAYRVVVFKVRGQVAMDLVRFVLVYALALGLNFLLLPAFLELVGLSLLPGQTLAFLLAAVGSYLAHKHFTFRRQSPGQMA